ncbi:hypothetical protein WMY93_000467 [Mugilogobius chulae]|uniref:C2H2-type domain-containing protein n=1 Tax=Mugilogobius chulae TaxID=88201 RepID=A0AAW0PZD1_9GOBI
MTSTDQTLSPAPIMPLCDDSLTQNSSPEQPQLVPSGDRPFSCNLCNKTFTRDTQLKRHKCFAADETPPEKVYKCTTAINSTDTKDT